MVGKSKVCALLSPDLYNKSYTSQKFEDKSNEAFYKVQSLQSDRAGQKLLNFIKIMDKEKMKENTIISGLVELDKKVSLSLSLSATKESPLGQYRPHMKALEYSCHGVFWISACIISLWFTSNSKKEAYLFNMLLALFLDIIFVAILKAVLHRKRPENNEGEDMFLTLSVDKMSCPSGHTSRAVMMTILLISSTPEQSIFHFLLILWCFCTSLSRVLLGRHHVGDVLVGLILGYFEYCIMDYVWAGPETAKWYLDIFKDSSSIIDDF